MKLLWVSNAPWSHSGYGSQTRQVGRRLLSAGVEVEFSANDGTRGDGTWEGALVRGSGADRYSRDSVREDVERSGADWTIVLYDPWVYTDRVTDPFTGNPRVAGWVPVDHYPVPPSMMPWLTDHTAIAMSQFGRDRLMEASDALRKSGKPGLTVRYAPHAVEPVFAPTEIAPGFGLPFREVIHCPPDAFLIGIVAANSGGSVYDRKGFGDMFQAAAAFMDRHPDAYLYLHTLHTGWQGINLPVLASVVGLDPKRVAWADQYLLKKSSIRDEDMAAIYSSFDVLLSTSRGEGFGLPVIEAQACGTPAIVSNWTAQPELVGEPWKPDQPKAHKTPSGWVVSVQPDYDDKHAAMFGKPNIGEIVVSLEDAYIHRGDQDRRSAAVAKAAEYRADVVFDRYWRPILAEMEAALHTTPKLLGHLPKKRKGRAA